MTHTEWEWQAMGRALALAARGPRGINPQVGAVILSPSGEVIAEGWHRGAGTAHAEVDALARLTAEQTRGATAVVTLEPCNHTGRTGPCALALQEAGIARVVYAVDDPGRISGGGAERLRAAGVEVVAGVRGDEGRELIAGWLDVVRLGRPHVTVKWAQSLDGRAAAADGTSQWITGPEARADVHLHRRVADAIVAGTGTLLADDPALTARRPDGTLYEDQPIPVVIGSAVIPPAARVRSHPREVLAYPTRDLHAVLADLRVRGVQRVFVEGGPTLASAFLRAGLADVVLTYVAPTLLGGPRVAIGDLGVNTMSEARKMRLLSTHRLGEDVLFVSALVEDPEDSPAGEDAGSAEGGR